MTNPRQFNCRDESAGVKDTDKNRGKTLRFPLY